VRGTEPAPSRGVVRAIRRSALIFGDEEDGNRVDEILSGLDELLGQVVVNAMYAGIGVQFQPTRYGGAISVGVWQGENLEKKYAGSNDELRALLSRILAYCRAMQGGDTKDAKEVAESTS
jgi:hypothetical protein